MIKLSKASKMPCQSFSLPAQACRNGSALASVKGSVCHQCYALKGMYRFPMVKASREHNLASLPTDLLGWDEWIDRMVKSIKGSFFRWFDSGDLQSMDMLVAICRIASRRPDVSFWLPTKEYRIIRKFPFEFPSNLIVRVSSPMMDQAPLKAFPHTSTVHQAKDPVGFVCPAPTQGGKCGDCRACWDKSIKNISYKVH